MYMKKILILVFFFAVNLVFSQTDTLFIAGKKYPLQKRDRVVYGGRSDKVLLPNQYVDIDHKISIPYVHWSDSISEQAVDPDDNIVEVKVWKKSCDTSNASSSYALYEFLDTISINASAIEKFKPYIKTKRGVYYFRAANILELRNGIINQYKHTHCPDGNILDVMSIKNLFTYEKYKGTVTYIIDDLYYTINEATYYLNRQFIVLVTN